MTCPGCGKKVDNMEARVMRLYGYDKCIECRKKLEQKKASKQ